MILFCCILSICCLTTIRRSREHSIYCKRMILGFIKITWRLNIHIIDIFGLVMNWWLSPCTWNSTLLLLLNSTLSADLLQIQFLIHIAGLSCNCLVRLLLGNIKLIRIGPLVVVRLSYLISKLVMIKRLRWRHNLLNIYYNLCRIFKFDFNYQPKL